MLTDRQMATTSELESNSAAIDVEVEESLVSPPPESDPAEPFARRLIADVVSMLQPVVPRATYRLQLHAEFTFADTEAIVPYLHDLGVSHLYLSPIFRAQPGSTHGYDVIDFSEVNPELGGREGFDHLVTTVREYGLGIILDFVPNHMGIARGANAWWQDVLENGKSSAFATFFDIDWDPIRPELRGKVLIPTLGDHYGVVLERGELRVVFDSTAGTFTLWYFETPFPIAPATYPVILQAALDLVEDLPAEDPDLLELQSILTSLERLPSSDESDPERLGEKQREQIVAKRRLAELVERSPATAAAISSAIDRLNGNPGDPRSFDSLDALIERQSFRLAFWRVAAEEINYRRFFAINELAAIRQEEPAVFAATHELLLDLLGAGLVDGVRLDHPDGLWDPAGYARDLQHAFVLARCRHHLNTWRIDEPLADAEAPPSWEELEPALRRLITTEPDMAPERPLYVLVEKILEHGETLPENWRVNGTTGYEFANAVTSVLVDPANRRPFDELYERIAGERVRFADMVYDCKHLIMRVALASEVAVLAASLDRITEQTRRFRDFTLNNLRDALTEVIACFPVYRTYLACKPDDPTDVDDRDRRVIESAIREAKRRNRALEPASLDFLRNVLLQRRWEAGSESLEDAQCRFAMKVQQLSGPVMAKGLEDTAFFRYNRLVALNEVGGDPAQFGLTPAVFHRQASDRARRWPHALLTTSTHDTKRGEDVRARIAAISGLPREWRAAINRWTRLNRRHKTRIEGGLAPDRNDEYLFYQTLIGAWPGSDHPLAADEHEAFLARLVESLRKSVREAQIHSSWVNVDDAYEAALENFVRESLSPAVERPFLSDLLEFRRRVTLPGAVNGLASQILKLTSPGVPDLYQGTEFWDLSLVDPDNRRPVDFGRRQRSLRDFSQRANTHPGRDNLGSMVDLLESWEDGRIKQWITQRLLTYRTDDPKLFAYGEYAPLEARGSHADHVLAFARRLGVASETRQAVVVVPRLVAKLHRGESAFPIGSIWGDTSITMPDSTALVARNVLTGTELAMEPVGDRTRLSLADVFSELPMAVLELVSAHRAD